MGCFRFRYLFCVAGVGAATVHPALGGAVPHAAVVPLTRGGAVVGEHGGGTGGAVGLHAAKLLVGTVGLGLQADGFGTAGEGLLGVCGFKRMTTQKGR